MKKFNITGLCIPDKHYMVNIDDKVNQIVALIEENEYFTINRARQYGKTTVINQLYSELKDKYCVIKISFEGLGDNAFLSEGAFCESFIHLVAKRLKQNKASDQLVSDWEENINNLEKFQQLSDKITTLVENLDRETILIIDEVDKSSDNQLFLHFIGLLRAKYLDRNEGIDKTFKSVIFAGVYDIKNLKLKLRLEEEKKYNSPWNIAADFNVNMTFNSSEISTMLLEYEEDMKTGMDILEISKLIYEYTSGYPFLVSKLCKIIETSHGNWTAYGIKNAVKVMLLENNTLFDDIIKNLENNNDMYNIIYSLIIEGKEFSYNIANPSLGKLIMFSIIDKDGEKVKMHNQIFEKYLYNYFISKTETSGMKVVNYTKSQFIDESGNLMMERVLNKFQELMKEEYRDKTEVFVEKEGRLIFLAFIKPIINGEGFYFVEAETRNNIRMDIVIAINKKQYIIELKKWYGKEYEEKGYDQLANYLELKKESEGYLIMFDFRKNKKEYTREWIEAKGKRIYEVVV